MLIHTKEVKENLQQELEVSDYLIKHGIIQESRGLKAQLDYLDTWMHGGDRQSVVQLFYDFAPHSFYFQLYVPVAVGKGIEYTNPDLARQHNELIGMGMYFNGGIIFHGSHDNGGDGGAPTFSVNLNPVNGWSIHT